MGGDPGAVPPVLGGAGEDCERSVKMKLTDEQRKLAEDYVSLAYKIAREFFYSGMEYDEVLGQAMLGLTEAAGTYDSAKGRFAAWVYPHVRNRILAGLKNTVPQEIEQCIWMEKYSLIMGKAHVH